MREAELWERLRSVLGDAYAPVWADQQVLSELGGRTVSQAVADGEACKKVWRAAWAYLELPHNLR